MLGSARRRPLAGLTTRVALSLATFTAAAAHAQVAMLPDGELAIAYRQLSDGELSQTVFQNYLRCFRGQCTLTALTLNGCMAGAFYPALRHWSTNDGSLSVDLVAPGTLVAEIKEGETTLKLRFTFDQKPGVRPWFAGLKKFSGGAVRQSSLSDKVITWELVPLRRPAIVEFSCPAALDGIPE